MNMENPDMATALHPSRPRPASPAAASPRRAARLAMLLLAATGCRGGGGDTYHPVFPPAPAEPRLIHRANVQTVADLSRPTLLDDLAGLIAGRSHPKLGRPSAVAHDGGRHLYIADMRRQAVHVFDTRRGRSRLIERAGDEYLVSPVGLAVLDDGQLAVADSALGSVFIFDARRRLVKSIAEPQRPTGMHYVVEDGELYITDTLAHRVLVYDRQLELNRTLGEPGHGPGQFNFPTHVFVDADRRVYVTDAMNFRVQVFDAGGRYLTHIGEHGDATGHLAVPKGVAVDSHGHIYIVDAYFSAVQVFDRRGRFLLAFGNPGDESGQFQLPNDLAMDGEDQLYIADTFNRRIQIFQYIGGPGDDLE